MTDITATQADIEAAAASLDADDVFDVFDTAYDDAAGSEDDSLSESTPADTTPEEESTEKDPSRGDHSPARPQHLAVSFRLVRHTKNTARFDEEATDEVAIGGLYLRHGAWRSLGEPETLTVRIEA